MSKTKKKDVLEKLAFDPNKYRHQQLLTFIRQGKYHDVLYCHCDWRLRWEVAKFASKDILIKMARSEKDVRILTKIAKRNIPEVSDILIECDDDCILDLIAENGRKRHLDILVKSKYTCVRKTVARHGSSEHLEHLLDDDEESVRKCVVVSENITKEQLDYMLSDDCPEVRAKIAERKFLDHLNVLVHDNATYHTGEFHHYGTDPYEVKERISVHANTILHQMLREKPREHKKMVNKKENKKTENQFSPLLYVMSGFIFGAMCASLFLLIIN